MVGVPNSKTGILNLVDRNIQQLQCLGGGNEKGGMWFLRVCI